MVDDDDDEEEEVPTCIICQQTGSDSSNRKGDEEQRGSSKIGYLAFAQASTALNRSVRGAYKGLYLADPSDKKPDKPDYR